ncbi:Transmembrane exosortase (Exosortase_EpsH) [uncultured archaeon]|nr:Transmembrane exosortase (Exosortase_EpsH) [uncultured archaeon]
MIAALWIALGLLSIASALPKAYNSRFIFGGLGWIFLSVYWFLQPEAYIGIQDYFNAFLVIIAAIVSIFIAKMTLRARNGNEGGQRDILISLSRAASVGGLIYFLFAEIEPLNTAIISIVTNQAIWITETFGFPVVQVAWNQLAVNGMLVEIILACTAIESIALFTGIISAAGAPAAQKLRAFMISVPVIYVLNLLRVFFTASAYGFGWFGTPDESFHISEHFITKAGSILALMLISYMVLKLLPEVSDMIDGIVKMMKLEFRKLSMR